MIFEDSLILLDLGLKKLDLIMLLGYFILKGKVFGKEYFDKSLKLLNFSLILDSFLFQLRNLFRTVD